MDVNFPSGQKPAMPNFNFGPWIIPFVIFMLALSAAGTLFYQIGPDEVAVVQRFGKYTRTENPGLRMKLPFGIETATKVKVTHVFKEEFGFATESIRTGIRTIYNGGNVRSSAGTDPFLQESLMLTGDLNVAIVEWIVQYTIKDPAQYLFSVRDPSETIRIMSEVMMRLIIGDHTINQILTSGREGIQAEVEEKLQQVLDSYNAGIAIRNVILQDVTPPDEVKPSFNMVNEARQEKEKLINNAWEEYNRVIPRAKGRAEQLLSEAEGYALERINEAKGNSERFILTLAEYEKAPEVTKRRLYLEMLKKVMPGLKDKVILDKDASSSILPLLNLNQIAQGGTE
jgi:membrane protease subunit HflK